MKLDDTKCNREKEITVHVNNQPVEVMGPRTSGQAIKQAAIDAGLNVALDFLLSIIRSENNTKRVGDEEEVAVNKNSRFALVSPDYDS